MNLVRPDPGPLPTPDQPLTRELLAEAWRHGIPGDWSSQRIAICVLDAHGGSLPVTEVMAYMATGEMPTRLTAESAHYWRSNAAIKAGTDGTWVLDPLHPSVASARQDYLFVGPDHVRTVASAIFLDTPAAGGLRASDHFGVWARFGWTE